MGKAIINKVRVDEVCYEIPPTDQETFWETINNCLDYETAFLGIETKAGNRVLVNLNNIKTIEAKR